MVAYIFCIAPLTKWALYMFNKEEGGIVPIHVCIVIGLIIINLLFNKTVRENTFNTKAIAFIMFCLALFAVNKVIYKDSTIKWPNYIVYCIMPMFVGMLVKVDAEKLLRYILYLSLLLIPVAGEYFSMHTTRTGAQLETIGMAASYNVMFFVMAAILHFVYYKNRGNKVIWIAYMANIYYFYQSARYGTRGIFICYAVLAVMIFLNRYDENEQLVRSSGKNTVIFITAVMVAAIVITNIEGIVTALYKALSSMHIKIYALQKSVTMIKSKEISNGRNEITDLAIAGIKEHFFVGNGIGMFTPNTGKVYPHNIILQLLYEVGIFLSLPFFWMIIKALIRLVNNTKMTKDNIVILTLFFCASVPRLMVSSQLWIQSAFWLMIICTLAPENFGGGETG
ncbi:MAG: hypothetical protein IJH94_01945 [Clostridia bacterium]|nr:hypothetical protein [Clostridia bacterium]